MAVQRCFWGRSSLHAELLESANATNNEKVLPQQHVDSHSFFKVFFLKFPSAQILMSMKSLFNCSSNSSTMAR